MTCPHPGDHCPICRDRDGGRVFRALFQQAIKVAWGQDFECPNGKPWGYVGDGEPSAIPAMPHDPTVCVDCEHLIESGVNCEQTDNQACGLLMSGNGHSPCVGAYLAVLRGQRKPPDGCPLRDQSSQ